MKPIAFDGATTDYGAPKGWDAQKDGVCNTLPIKVDEACNIISVWELTPQERLQIARGDNVVLTCYTIQPPVTLSVAGIGAAKLNGAEFVENDGNPNISPELAKAFRRSSPMKN